MHGRLKVRTSAEEAARKKKEQELKVKAYKAGMSRIFDKRSRNELDDELLTISGQILGRNPDVYTLWNIRKECILSMQRDMEPDDKLVIYDKDLNFTEQCLMVNPKSYGAWHHRCWILENSPKPDWDKEVALCTKYLKLDERNFHCWDYRRYVVAKAEVPPEKEFEFCTEKIRNNFSNYSSWHYRSKLMPLLFPHTSDPIRPISEEKLKDELEMVLTAAFTDPNDSSAWFYQRWLLGYSLPAFDLAAFRISKSQAVITFTKAVDIRSVNVQLNVDVGLNSTLWQSPNSSLYDNTWVAFGNFKLSNLKENSIVMCNNEEKTFSLDIKKCSDGYFGLKCPKFEYEFGTAVVEQLMFQLSSCNELLELEPDSKWTLLTAALLMRAIDRRTYHYKSLDYLEKLQTIDFLRKGYYEDLASKWNTEMRLEEWINSENAPNEINLSNLQLTSICYEQYLSIADRVNLRKNKLTSRSLSKIKSFQFAKSLDISANLLITIENVPRTPMLQNLNVTDNQIETCVECIEQNNFNIQL